MDDILTETAPSLPAVPRPLTSRARRRSWNELPVRVWMILSLVVLLVTVYYAVTRISEAMQDRWLIEHGVNINAIFVEVDGDPFPKRRPRTQTMVAQIKFNHNRTEYKLLIQLEPKENAVAVVGQPLPIKIDPENPHRWTEATVPRPWAHELAAMAILLPILAIVTVVMLWRRRTVLKVWRNGELAEAVVVETRQTPTAPWSRLVRWSLREGVDRRIRTVLIPASAGVPEPGELIWLIHAPANPGRALVARLYQQNENI